LFGVRIELELGIEQPSPGQSMADNLEAHQFRKCSMCSTAQPAGRCADAQNVTNHDRRDKDRTQNGLPPHRVGLIALGRVLCDATPKRSCFGNNIGEFGVVGTYNRIIKSSCDVRVVVCCCALEKHYPRYTRFFQNPFKTTHYIEYRLCARLSGLFLLATITAIFFIGYFSHCYCQINTKVA